MASKHDITVTGVSEEEKGCECINLNIYTHDASLAGSQVMNFANLYLVYVYVNIYCLGLFNVNYLPGCVSGCFREGKEQLL